MGTRQPASPVLRKGTGTRSKGRGSWVFGSTLLAYLMVVVFVLPDPSPFQEQLLRLFMALLGGLLSYFLVGDIVLHGNSGPTAKIFTATGGFAVFLVIYLVPAVTAVREIGGEFLPSIVRTDPALRDAQQRLQELKFLDKAPDGIRDSATSSAIKRFQAENSIPATGILSNETLKALKITPSALHQPKQPQPLTLRSSFGAPRDDSLGALLESVGAPKSLSVSNLQRGQNVEVRYGESYKKQIFITISRDRLTSASVAKNVPRSAWRLPEACMCYIAAVQGLTIPWDERWQTTHFPATPPPTLTFALSDRYNANLWRIPAEMSRDDMATIIEEIWAGRPLLRYAPEKGTAIIVGVELSGDEIVQFALIGVIADTFSWQSSNWPATMAPLYKIKFRSTEVR